jgi:hypothetical protein
MTDEPTAPTEEPPGERTDGSGGRGAGSNGAGSDRVEASDDTPLRVSPVDRSVQVPGTGSESLGQRGALSASNWLPTRFSTLVVVLLTAVATVAFANAVGLAPIAAVAAVSALSLAGALRLVTIERWRLPARLVATVLLVPVGVGLAGSLLAGFLVMQSRLFPVSTTAQYVGATLRAIGALVVVAGAALAWFGAATATRDAVERETLRRTLGVSFRTAVPPFLLALLGGTVALAESPLYPPTVGPAGLVGGLVSAAVDLTIAPPTASIHPTTLALLGVVAAWAAAKLVDTLPVSEVVGADSPVVRAAERLGTVAKLGIVVVLAAAVVEFLLPARTLIGTLGFSGYRLLVGITTTPLLRLPLALFAVVAIAVVVLFSLVRRAAQAPADRTIGAVLPYAVGAALAVGTGSVARPVVEALLDAVGSVLISPFDQVFAEVTESVVDFYGPELILTALLAGVLVLTATVVLLLYLADRLGYVRDRANGASLAATGLFLAAAFSVPVGAPATLAFAGLVASVLAWDVGLYGATIAQEVGRRTPTARVELTHATGTALVGLLGVALAVGLTRLLNADGLAVPAGIPVASSVLLALGGVFLLVAVLRATES